MNKERYSSSARELCHAQQEDLTREPAPPSAKNLYLTHQRLVILARILLPITIITITVLALIPPKHVPLAGWGDGPLHISAFFTLAALVDTAWPQKKVMGLKLFWLALFGLAIEVTQSFYPLRTFALDDLVANTVGLGIYIFLIPLFKRLPITQLRWQGID